ncbi:MAG: MBL fold metallo-hydrolase [Epsilonproteobacteria bacterium]|nr:MBL fold metallo-hydrolase [Campylobacterota bacterium]
MLKTLSTSLALSAMLLTTTLYADNNHTSHKTETKDSNFDYKLSPKKVSENVWCFLGALEGPSKENAGDMVNTCYVKTKDSFVLIDSGPSYEYARQAYDTMSKIANLPVKTVITTHEHDDHWLGNSFYKDKFSAEIIGPKYINDHYKEGQETRMFRVLPENAIKGTKIIKVDTTPDKTLKLTVGGEEFEMVPIGQKAHTEEDFFVYMPKRKVLFAGDLAMNGRITSNRHGSLLGQLKAIEMMKAKEWDIFVPGHGTNTGKTAMDDAEKYFTLLHERIVKAMDDDVEADEITSVVTMDEFKDRAMFKALNARNVSDAYTEIEFAED